MVALASRSIAAGEANVVVCVWADAPLRADRPAGSVYRQPRRGWNGLLHQTGVRSPTIHYALAARRHMQRYGTTHEQLGAIAVAQRDWAALNPRAQMRTPITIEDYLSARWGGRSAATVGLLPGVQRRRGDRGDQPRTRRRR
jgi:acetyl-CoA acetyltransferase